MTVTFLCCVATSAYTFRYIQPNYFTSSSQPFHFGWPTVRCRYSSMVWALFKIIPGSVLQVMGAWVSLSIVLYYSDQSQQRLAEALGALGSDLKRPAAAKPPASPSDWAMRVCWPAAMRFGQAHAWPAGQQTASTDRQHEFAFCRRLGSLPNSMGCVSAVSMLMRLWFLFVVLSAKSASSSLSTPFGANWCQEISSVILMFDCARVAVHGHCLYSAPRSRFNSSMVGAGCGWFVRILSIKLVGCDNHSFHHHHESTSMVMMNISDATIAAVNIPRPTWQLSVPAFFLFDVSSGCLYMWLGAGFAMLPPARAGQCHIAAAQYA